jgi:hypothetical protein
MSALPPKTDINRGERYLPSSTEPFGFWTARAMPSNELATDVVLANTDPMVFSFR